MELSFILNVNNPFYLFHVFFFYFVNIQGLTEHVCLMSDLFVSVCFCSHEVTPENSPLPPSDTKQIQLLAFVVCFTVEKKMR